MDLASLQPSHSLNVPAGHQPSPGASVPSGSILPCRQSTSGLPGKAIGQRWCQVDRSVDSDSSVSDSEYLDPVQNVDSSDDDYFDAPEDTALPTVPEQEIEQKTGDGDGPWQIVTRRKSRHKGQRSPVVPSGNGAAWVKGSVQARHVPASHSLTRHSASNRVIGKSQRVQTPVSEQLSLLSSRSCSYWSLCVRSFARFGTVDWVSFQACQVKFHMCLQTRVTEDEFLRFHHMMTEGPQAISRADDIVFFVGPLKVLLSEYELSTDAVFLSLIFEGITPGFLRMLGERFIAGLSGAKRKDEELFAAITELLAQIGQKSVRWLDRLGWQDLTMRNKCSLFSSVAFFFKHGNKLDLIRGLHRQVSCPWLEKYHYNTVQRLSCVDGDPDAQLRNLRASVRAVFFWLDLRFFVIPGGREDSQLVACFADIVQSVIEVMDRRDQQPNTLWLAVWQAVAQWSVRFSRHLSTHLGFDRAIDVLNGVLRHIPRWSELESLAFELRLVLVGTVLTKCEEFLLKRDNVLFSHAWFQHETMLESLLAKCNQFMGHYQTAFRAANQRASAQRKEEVRLQLLLKESAFHRLSCVIHKTPRQQIQEKLQTYCIVHDQGWALNYQHREIGAIELAKWYFLADEHVAGVRSLMARQFRLVNLSWRKADLLARHGVYQAAIDEYRHAKTLITDPAARHNRDKIDGRIAMTRFQWFEAENNTDHLIEAYRLSVDLLGRSSIQNRGCFEGGLVHIVNAMKNNGFRFEDYVGQTSVLGYMVKDGCGIKSWQHFADLLYIRHKMGLTGADAVNKVADQVSGKNHCFIGLGKQA